MEPPRNRTKKILSFLTPDQCRSCGKIPGVAIQGVFTDDECGVRGFRPNGAFIEFMHHVIRTEGVYDHGLLEAAAQQKNGRIYMIDSRTPDGPEGTVPMEDIIGTFEVRDGNLLPDSYEPNSDHRILTKNGPVQLPPFLKKALVRAAIASLPGNTRCN